MSSPSPVHPSQSSRSPLVPSKERSVLANLTFSYPHPSNAVGEKWFVHTNKANDQNYVSEAVAVTIYDLRGQEHLSHIDKTGFQALTSPSSVPADFLLNSTEEEIARVYYPEVVELIKKNTGASRVVVYDHTVRKQPQKGVDGISTPDSRQPVLRTHVDQTPASSFKRVDRHVQPPQPFKRVQLINLWRPIGNKVYDYPLAVCDFNTVDVENDLEPTTLVYPPPTPNGETYSLRFNKNQVWWYWSEMTPDDFMLLKCYDSASRELARVTRSGAKVDENELRDVAGSTPHTAFLDEEGAKKGIQRQSIEVRTLVFYD